MLPKYQEHEHHNPDNAEDLADDKGASMDGFA